MTYVNANSIFLTLICGHGTGTDMTKQFKLAPLRGDRILQAYPLVREVAGEFSVAEWRAFVKTMLKARAGGADRRDIVGIRSSNDYLRGLFTYRVVPDLRHGRTLDVEFFMVESVFSPREIAASLMAGVEDVARAEDCNAIHVNLPPHASWLVNMLHERGYSAGTWQLCKRFDDGSGVARIRAKG